MIKIIFSSFFLLFGGLLKSYTEILRPGAFLGNKLVFPQLESVLPMATINEWSLPALISTLLQAFYYILPPLSSWGGAWWSGFGEHLASSQGQIYTVEHQFIIQLKCFFIILLTIVKMLVYYLSKYRKIKLNICRNTFS